MTSQTVTVTDTVAITDTRSVIAQHTRVIADMVGIVDTVHSNRALVGISDTVGVSGSATYVLSLIQFDTWRPIMSPGNSLILACRTPEGEHDSPTGFTHMTLWTFKTDGSHENAVAGPPSLYGWTSFGHPEWSPDGISVVIYAEDNTTYKIVVLDATGYDRPLP